MQRRSAVRAMQCLAVEGESISPITTNQHVTLAVKHSVDVFVCFFMHLLILQDLIQKFV